MLKNKTKIAIFSLLIILIAGAIYTFYFNNKQVDEISSLVGYETLFAAGACSSHNVYGWAYSPVVGPISLNCANCDQDNNGYVDTECGGLNTSSTPVYDYGVDIDVDGNLTGYAWSESAGPISFNNTEICSHSPCLETDFPVADQNSEFSAKVVWVEQDRSKIMGWARAISACSFNGSYCTTNSAGDNAGGWDGWIKFDSDATLDYSACSGGVCGGGSKYNTLIETVGGVHEINGNAWGGVLPGEESEATPAAILGEIIFVDVTTDFDPDNVCAVESPTAAFHAVCVNGNITSGNCYYDSNEDVTLDNDSVDPDTANCGSENIETSEWDWDGSPTPSCSSAGLTNCGLDLSSFTDPITKTIELTVTDYQLNSGYISHIIDFKKAISADFSCCIKTDTVDCLSNSDFQDCDNYKTRTIMEGTTMYIKDNISVVNHSVASVGTSINARSWAYDGGSITVSGTLNELCELLITDDGIVEMTVTDGLSLSDTQTLDFSEFGNIIINPEFVEK